MEKRVCAKFSRLNNVVGRVDYISNPKRQENLLGFYQTPEDPAQFWKALSDEAQEYSAYNKNQIEEHNREQRRKFAAGEIKRKDLWSTVEARENVLCLPNDLYGKVDNKALAKFIAEDIKTRHGIECAVGIHMNKTGTNFHAHIILPERRELEQLKISIATRDTYFDADGKRSTKKECLENGILKPGCRVVKKGEKLHQRRFLEKDNLFSSKRFMYGEKIHFADLFNQLSCDRWVVYNHQTNPHLRLYSYRREEPEGLRAWKERENSTIRQYNDAIDRKIESGELTVEQALRVKQQLYAERAEERENRIKEREAWTLYYESRRAEFERARRARQLIRYSESGRERTTIELIAILGLTIAGVKLFKDNTIDDTMIVHPKPQRRNVEAVRRFQARIDQIYIAAGQKSPSELLAERKVQKLGGKKPSLTDLIIDAEQKKEYPPIEDGNVNSRRDVL